MLRRKGIFVRGVSEVGELGFLSTSLWRIFINRFTNKRNVELLWWPWNRFDFLRRTIYLRWGCHYLRKVITRHCARENRVGLWRLYRGLIGPFQCAPLVPFYPQRALSTTPIRLTRLQIINHSLTCQLLSTILQHHYRYINRDVRVTYYVLHENFHRLWRTCVSINLKKLYSLYSILEWYRTFVHSYSGRA